MLNGSYDEVNMRKRKAIGLIGLGLTGIGLYALRRRVIARLLNLPPARFRVGVERDLRVPMPDGVGLYADHYFPLADGSFPTILIRSYYGRSWDAGGPMGLMYGWLARRFAERGYHVIIQCTRGRFDSEGEVALFADAQPDGRATLDWIARQTWFDGNLGLWGQSYLGYVQWAVVADAPPFLKALAPSITTSQFSSVIHADGAFSLDTSLRWAVLVEMMDSQKARSKWASLRGLIPSNIARRIAPAFRHLPLAEADVVALGYPVDYYQEGLAHPPEDKDHWQAIDHRSAVSRVTVPVHLTSGWYDFLLRELLTDYEALKTAGRMPYLTIGPWAHAELAVTVETLQEGLVWFDAHLKGDRRRLRGKPVRLYVMGAEEWREMESWPPPAQETRFFLQEDERLSLEKPDADSPPDHYRYDPADPTPAVGGSLLMPPAGPADNRALEARPDVLCYTTSPLANDLDVIGSVRLELYVRSSLAHTDFFGRLCDVYPDGRSINVCDGLFRVEPGKGQPGPDGTLCITIDLWSTAYRFQQGHCLRLQVSSGAHPRWSRNLGTGEPIGHGTRMMVAEQTIYHGRTSPSALILPIPL
jgi:putative CocE/NonD family hydrolase